LSLIAAFGPLRRETQADPRRDEPRWGWFSLVLAVTLVLGGYGAFQLYAGKIGERKTMALLAGDQSVHFARLETEYYQRRVICRDPEVLRYFETLFRQHDRKSHGDQLGITQRLTAYYGEGGYHSFGAYWNDDHVHMFPDGGDDYGDDPYSIVLTNPVPP